MSKDKSDRIPFLESVPHILAETARMSVLAGRNYYKNCLKTEDILELDEFVMLCHIISTPKSSQSDISKKVYKGKAHVGKILNEMEQKGYIKRVVASENNIMVKYNEVTELGKKLFEATDEVFYQLYLKYFSDFTDAEIETFKKLLLKHQAVILANQKIEF